MSDKIDYYNAIIGELKNTYIAKNHDYGDSFSESVDDYGLIAGVVRIGDKYNRLKTLVKGKDPLVTDETIEDTLLDMANYAIMTLVECRSNTRLFSTNI